MTKQLIWREDLLKLIPTGGRVAELGVQWGYFAATMLYVCQPAELVLVDCWRHQGGAYAQDSSDVPDDEQDRRFAFVREKFGPYRQVKIHRSFTREVAPLYSPGYFDLIYLDACHLRADVDRDLRDWWPLVKSGGLFCGHDYWQVNVPFIQVAPAVDQFCRERGRELDYITLGSCGSWGLWKR
jgi:hypothetical protein